MIPAPEPVLKMNMEFDVTQAQANGTPEELRKAAITAIYAEASQILSTSQDIWCPVVTGHLRRSGYVREPVASGNNATVEIGYSAEYARVVHEAPPEWGQGLNKFLERPMLMAKIGFEKRMARRVRAMLGDAAGLE